MNPYRGPPSLKIPGGSNTRIMISHVWEDTCYLLGKQTREQILLLIPNLQETIKIVVNNPDQALQWNSSIRFISCSQHYYTHEWSNIQCSMRDLYGMLAIITRYECNKLQLRGQSIYLLFMMLSHGIRHIYNTSHLETSDMTITNDSIVPSNESVQSSSLPLSLSSTSSMKVIKMARQDDEQFTNPATIKAIHQDVEFTSTLIETMLRIIVEYSVYGQCIQVLQVLVERFGILVHDIFVIGCSLFDQLPELIDDDNFIGLLNFVVYIHSSTPLTSQISLPIIKFLTELAGHLLGDIRSRFMTAKVSKFIKDCMLATVQNSRGSSYHEDMSWYGARMLKAIMTVHVKSVEDVSKNDDLLEALFTLIKSSSTSTAILSELFQVMNLLCNHNAASRKLIKQQMTMAEFETFLLSDRMGAYDGIIDLFLNLYEVDLTYNGEAMQYVLTMDTVYGQFIEKFMNSLIHALAQPEVGQDISGDEHPAFSHSRLFPTQLHDHNSPNKANTTGIPVNSSSGYKYKLVNSRKLEILWRVCYRLERSIRIISNAHLLLPQKIIIIQLLDRVFAQHKGYERAYTHAVDIFLLMLRSSEICWESYGLDPMDNELLSVSQKLVEEFLNLASVEERSFDVRDRNALNYLAGSDAMSTIQDTIRVCGGREGVTPTKGRSDYNGRSYSHIENEEEVGSIAEFPIDVSIASHNEPTHYHRHRNSYRNPSSDYGQYIIDDDRKLRDEIDEYFSLVQQLLFKLLQPIDQLFNVITDWPVQRLEANIQLIPILYLLASIVGWDSMQLYIIDSQELADLVLILLTQERLVCKNHPNIERKCVQLLVLICQSNDAKFANVLEFAELITKMIGVRPERNLPTALISIADAPAMISESARETINLFESLESRSCSTSSQSTFTSSHALSLSLNLDLHYTAISCLIVLSRRDRVVRRRLVKTCAESISSLYFLAPSDPINYRPVLHLIHSMIEFLSKVESAAQEAIVSALIRSLRSPLPYIQSFACELIYLIGQSNPGFVYSGLSRLEVEEPIISILRRSQQQDPCVVLSALKASSVLVHNINLKPIWLPLPTLYHWSQYQHPLQSRTLATKEGVKLILRVLTTADVSFRLPYFVHIIAITSSLMYACVDGLLQSSLQEEDGVKDLRDCLIAAVMPLLPMAIDFITVGRKKKRRGADEPSLHTNSPLGSRATIANLGMAEAAGSTIGGPLSLRRQQSSLFLLQDFVTIDCSRTAPFTIVTVVGTTESAQAVAERVASRLSASSHAEDTDNTALGDLEETKQASAPPQQIFSPTADEYRQANEFSLKIDPNNSFVTRRVSLPSQNTAYSSTHRVQDVVLNLESIPSYQSAAMEFLTEKTMEALYAFLCTDEMFPISTYLQYISLFETCGLIASISYFMKENKRNAKILRRGISFLRHFTENHLHLSTIAMHAPVALITAAQQLCDHNDVQLSFAKIVWIIARSDDDFACENFLRFQMHLILLPMVISTQLEVSRMAVLALSTLLNRDVRSVEMICQGSGLVDAVLVVMERYHTEVTLQVLALQILIVIDRCLPDLISSGHQRHHIFQSMKRARKFLLKELQLSNAVGDASPSAAMAKIANSSAASILNSIEIDLEEVLVLMIDPIWKKDKCVVS